MSQPVSNPPPNTEVVIDYAAEALKPWVMLNVYRTALQVISESAVDSFARRLAREALFPEDRRWD